MKTLKIFVEIFIVSLILNECLIQFAEAGKKKGKAKKFGMFYYEFYNNLFLKILDLSIAGWFKSFASQSLQLHFIHLNSWEIKLEIKRFFNTFIFAFLDFPILLAIVYIIIHIFI